MTRRSIRTMATFRINTEALEASARLGVVSPRRTVPPHIPRPDYSLLSSGQPSIKSRQIHLLSKAEIDQMKRACQIASYIREYAGKQVSVGITTDEIDRRVHEEVGLWHMISSSASFYSIYRLAPLPCATLLTPFPSSFFVSYD